MAKFYKCAKCGSVVVKLNPIGCTPSCCDEPMQELRVGTVDAAQEKHVPVVAEKDGKVYVQIGSVAHPMVEDHWIEWVYLLTDKGGSFHFLKPGDEPKTVFSILEDEVVLEVYAYCNKHGLWKADLD
jgi:superoxide reductase